MEILMALLLGTFVGWASPLVGRSPGLGTLLDMLVGAVGGLVGWALGSVLHADLFWLVWLGAAVLLAVVGFGKGRIIVSKPPAG